MARTKQTPRRSDGYHIGNPRPSRFTYPRSDALAQREARRAAYLRELEQERLELERQNRRGAAATRIQANFRGHTVRSGIRARIARRRANRGTIDNFVRISRR